MRTYTTIVSTVGENPLPIYLGILQFTENSADTKVILVHSIETQQEANHIERAVTPRTVLKVCLSNPYNPEVVEREMTRLSKTYRDSALNYTGGTKVMSAYGLKAWSDHLDDAFYLDDAKRKFWFQGAPVDLTTAITLNTLNALHTAKLSRISATMPQHLCVEDTITVFNNIVLTNRDPRNGNLRLPDGLKQEDDKAQYNWLKNNYDDAGVIAGSKWDDVLRELTPLSYDAWRQSILPASLTQYKNSEVSRQVNYLTGFWFEAFVAMMIIGLNQDGSVALDRPADSPLLSSDDIALNPILKLRRTEFEADILVTNNFALRYISVTTSQGAKYVKGKLFEAVHRSQQIGGGLARSCVVSLAGKDQAGYVPTTCEQTLNDDNHRVFGLDDVRTWYTTGKASSLLNFLTD